MLLCLKRLFVLAIICRSLIFSPTLFVLAVVHVLNLWAIFHCMEMFIFYVIKSANHQIFPMGLWVLCQSWKGFFQDFKSIHPHFFWYSFTCISICYIYTYVIYYYTEFRYLIYVRYIFLNDWDRDLPVFPPMVQLCEQYYIYLNN